MDYQSRFKEKIEKKGKKYTVYDLDVQTVKLQGINFRICRTGFFQWYGVRTLGSGLNEGYLEIYGVKKYPDCLSILERYTCCVEQIIGRRKMQQLYSACNLYGVVDELERFSSKEDVYKFLIMLDEIHDLLPEKNTFGLSRSKNKVFYECCNGVENFLENQFVRKIAQERLSGKISDDGVYSMCVNYSTLLYPEGCLEEFYRMHSKVLELTSEKVLSYK